MHTVCSRIWWTAVPFASVDRMGRSSIRLRLFVDPVCGDFA